MICIVRCLRSYVVAMIQSIDRIAREHVDAIKGAVVGAYDLSRCMCDAQTSGG